MGQAFSCPGREDPDHSVSETKISGDAPSSTQYNDDDGLWMTMAKYWWEHWALTWANAMAWYEFAAYASMEQWISQKFFYGSDSLAWMAFGLSFVGQCFGGFAIGCLADQFGRRPAMLTSLCVMFFSTTGQGVAPEVPYLGTGWMLLCRVFQGLASGGELGSITVFMSETIPRKALSMSGLVISTGISLGFTISTLVSYVLVKILNDDQMNAFGWRIPFLLAGIPVAYGLYKAWGVEESPEFEALHQEGNESTLECMKEEGQTVLRDYWAHGLLAIAGVASSFAQQYLGGAYLEVWLVETVGYSESSAFLILLANQFVMTVSSFPVAVCGDIYGLGKFNLFGSACAVAFSVPMFWMLSAYPGSMVAIWIGGILIPGILQGLTVSTNPWVAQFFPTEVRATAVSLYFNVGQALGGFAPVICALIPGPLVPGWYSVIFGVVSVIANVMCLYIHDEYKKTGKGMRIVYLRSEPY